MDDLALQIGFVDCVELDDAKRAHTCCRQVQQRRATQATGPDDQNLCVLQPLLPVHPHVGNDEVTAVPADLVDGQVLSRFHERWQGHVSSTYHFAFTRTPSSTIPNRIA